MPTTLIQKLKIGEGFRADRSHQRSRQLRQHVGKASPRRGDRFENGTRQQLHWFVTNRVGIGERIEGNPPSSERGDDALDLLSEGDFKDPDGPDVGTRALGRSAQGSQSSVAEFDRIR
jgi:hypothetical protein